MARVRFVAGPACLLRAVLSQAPVSPIELHTREILFRDAYKPLSARKEKPKVVLRTPIVDLWH